MGPSPASVTNRTENGVTRLQIVATFAAMAAGPAPRYGIECIAATK